MELALFVWLASIVGGVANLLGFMSIVLTGVIIMALAHSFIEEKPFKLRSWVVPVLVVCGLISVLLPSQKTMYLMAGVWAGQAVVQSETADKVLKIVNGKLDEYLNDVEKSSKEGVER